MIRRHFLASALASLAAIPLVLRGKRKSVVTRQGMSEHSFTVDMRDANAQICFYTHPDAGVTIAKGTGFTVTRCWTRKPDSGSLGGEFT